MTPKPCPSKNKKGEPCQTRVTKSGYCWFHDPARKKARATARALGGKNRERTTAKALRRKRLEAPPVVIAAPADVLKLLSETLTDVRREAIKPEIARSIGVLCGVSLRVFSLDKSPHTPPAEPAQPVDKDERPLSDVPTADLMALVRPPGGPGSDAEH